MKCSVCFNPLDEYGLAPTIDAWTGAPICDACVDERRGRKDRERMAEVPNGEEW